MAKKPNASRKPGGEGLPYKDAGSVCGGPVENEPKPGLGAGEGMKGSKSLPRVASK